MPGHIKNKEKLTSLYKNGSIGTYTFCRKHEIPLSTMFKWLKQAEVQPKGKMPVKQNKKTSFKKLEVCDSEIPDMEHLPKTNAVQKTMIIRTSYGIIEVPL